MKRLPVNPTPSSWLAQFTHTHNQFHPQSTMSPLRTSELVHSSQDIRCCLLSGGARNQPDHARSLSLVHMKLTSASDYNELEFKSSLIGTNQSESIRCTLGRKTWVRKEPKCIAFSSSSYF